jgi:hypothetical protein
MDRHRWSRWLMCSCGAWLLGLGAFFVFLRPPLLPEDLRYIGVTLEALRAAAPALEGWLAKVFVVMGGFMAGAGALTLYVALSQPKLGWLGTVGVLAFTGLVTVGLMSAVNFALGSEYRWLLVVPMLAWAFGTWLHV